LLEMLSTDPAKEQDAVAEEMNLFLENGFPALFRVARNLVGIGEQREESSTEALARTLNAMLAWFRDAMLAKVMGPAAFQHLSLHVEEEAFRRFVSGTSLEGLAEAFLAAQRAATYVPRQTDRQYVLELVLSRIGRALRPR
jgi:triphosphoribosyl-dephospho-CoA synthetase